MPRNGTPDRATQRYGALIAQLRTARGWSRARLISRLCRELDSDDPCADVVSESWLARLETGRMVKVSRQTMEAICRAIGCNAYERTRLLLYADRNVLSNTEHDPTPAAEILNYVMDRLYEAAHQALAAQIAQRPAPWSDAELFQMTSLALQQAMKMSR